MVVKPLEWGEHHGYHADSIVGTYHVRHDGDEPEEWSWSRNGGMHYYFSSQEEAQTAAEADYQARILSAIESPDLIAADPTMLEALRKLANEVGGLRAFESELRAELGNTNWSVLMLRLREAEAAIALAEGRTPTETKGGASDE